MSNPDSEDDAPFDGETLFTVMAAALGAQTWPSPALSCRLAMALCEELESAHRRVDSRGRPSPRVHGGLSLSLVMVGRDGAVKIAWLPPGLESMGQLSPEQVEGHSPDCRSDVFCAGMALYFLLTGEVPFSAVDEAQERAALLAGELLPCSKVLRPPGAEKHGPVPGPLEAIAMRALERSPDRRFADGGVLRRALEEAAQSLGLASTREDVARLVRVLCPPLPVDASEPHDGLTSRNPAELFALLEKLTPRPGPPCEIEVFFDDDLVPEGLTNKATSERCAELLDLGFVRLGIKVEHLEGHPRVSAIAFSSPSKSSFAAIFFQSDTHQPRLYFHTPLEGGRVVTTGAYPRTEFRSEYVVQSGAGDRPAAQVLEAHLEEVAAMVKRGAVLWSDFSRDGYIEATRAFFRSPHTSKPSPKKKRTTVASA